MYCGLTILSSVSPDNQERESWIVFGEQTRNVITALWHELLSFEKSDNADFFSARSSVHPRKRDDDIEREAVFDGLDHSRTQERIHSDALSL